jgi:predicted RNase H-like nuclease
VLGVDACPGGWVGLAWGGGERLWAYHAATVAALVEACRADGPVALVGVDIPIGLSDTGTRDADVAVRGRLGVRRSSVFEAPVRAALQAPDHATAVAVNRAATGRGISVQAYGLRHRVMEVDGWLRAEVAGDRPAVYEVHPELSFARMAGHPLPDGKRTWAGAERRRMLLVREGLFVADLGEAGRRAHVDDVLDAAAATWTAGRILTGDAESLPDPPQLTPDGLAAAIWV